MSFGAGPSAFSAPLTIAVPEPEVAFRLGQDLGEVFGPRLGGFRAVSVLIRSTITFSDDGEVVTKSDLQKDSVLVARMSHDSAPHRSFIGKFSAHGRWAARSAGLEKEAVVTDQFSLSAPGCDTPSSVEAVAFARAGGMAAFVVPEYMSDLGPSCWDPAVRAVAGDLFVLMRLLEAFHVFADKGVLSAAVEELWGRTRANISIYQHCDVKPENIFIYDVEYRAVRGFPVITRVCLVLGDFGEAQVKGDVVPAGLLGGTWCYSDEEFVRLRREEPRTQVVVGSEIYDDRRGWDLTLRHARRVEERSAARFASALEDPTFVPISRAPPRLERRDLRCPSWSFGDAGSPDSEIAGSPDSEIAGSPDSEIAGSPDSEIAGGAGGPGVE